MILVDKGGSPLGVTIADKFEQPASTPKSAGARFLSPSAQMKLVQNGAARPTFSVGPRGSGAGSRPAALKSFRAGSGYNTIDLLRPGAASMFQCPCKNYRSRGLIPVDPRAGPPIAET